MAGPRAGCGIGIAILAEAQAVGAGPVVMDAFTHKRTFEALFGGVLRDVLDGATFRMLLHLAG